MSRTIDERVVEMRFDNKQFESGTKQTLGTLEKLKQALKFQDVGKGFDAIQKSANRVDMNGIGNAVEGVKVKFSALEIAAITALTNIVNRAVDAGVRLAKSLSIDQVTAGFAEYELKMGSIQTIIASTGESLETVNKYLEELNEYSDKTIYSFSDMTSNIGKFTNAGVKLEDAVKAIQGVSNAAAVAGVNSNQASQAMYNFAQALSTGYVQLIDWKSIKTANMDTMEFKQQLLDTALAMGTVVKEGNKYKTTTTDMRGKISDLFNATSAFNESLSHQWLTTDVLVQTLGNYSTDVRTMTAAEKEAYEEKLRGIGYTEDQIKAIEELGKKAFDSAQDVKTFHQLIDTMRESVGSGWAQTFELIFGDFEEAKKLWTNVNNTLGAIIKESSDSRNELLRGWKEAGGRDDLITGISNSFNALLSVVKAVGEAFRSVFPKTTSTQLVSITKGFRSLTEQLKPSEAVLNNLKRTFTGLFSIIDIVGQAAGAFFKLLIPGVSTVGDLGEGILGVTASIGDWVTNLNKAIKENGVFIAVVEKIREVIGNALSVFVPFKENLDLLFEKITSSGLTVTGILEKLGDALSFLFGAISKAFGAAGFNSIYDLFNVAVLSGIATQLFKFFKSMNKPVDSAGGFLKNIKSIISGVTESFDELQTTLKSATLKNIAVSLALIAGSIFVLSTIDSEKLAGSLGAVTVLITELTAIFVLLNKLDKNKKSAIRSINSLISIAFSILILSSALKKVSDIDSEKLIGSLGAITVLLVEMTAISVVLSKYGGKVKTGVLGIIAFSAAIYIISSSVKKLGELNIDALTKGLVSVGVLLAELTAFMIGAKFGKFKTSQAIGITILAASLLILQKVVEGFGSMQLSQIGKGLLAIAGALAEITLAMGLLPKNTLSIGVGLLATAGALTIISNAVLNMSGMSWEEIAKGMTSLGGSMAILAISMNAMKGTLGASAAMLVMSASLAIFVPVLKSLGSMSWLEIAKGLIALAGGFALVGAAGVLLSPVIPAMLGLAGAMALLGVATVAVGAGVLALSAGLTTLAASGVAGAAALVGVAKILVVGFLNAISDSVSALGRTIKTLILTACDVLLECIPTIVKTVLVLVKDVLTALADNAPEIVTQILKLVVEIIDTLAANLPTVIQSVVNLFMQFFAGLIQALNAMDIDTLVDAIAGIGLIAAIMLALAAMASLAPSAMAGVLGLGAVIAELAIVLAVIGALAQIPGLKWLIGEGGALLQGVGQAIGNFIGGIIGGVMGGIAAQLPQMGADLSSFMTNLQPFIEGSKNIDAEALDCVDYLAAIILALSGAEVVNGIVSLLGLSLVDMAVELSDFMVALQPFIENSKELNPESMKACEYLATMIITLTAAEILTGIGKMFGLSGSLTDFGKELSEFGPYIKQFAEDVKDVKPEAVQGAASAAEIMAEMAKKLPGTGGFVQKIFGERSLADFGKELVKFGPKIKAFGEIVKDVKPEAVQGAASAAEIMATLANKLPAQGGLVQKFFGERSLADFGTELVAFGPKISKFAEQVKGVEPSAANGASAVATIMSNLANNLPSSETLWDKIFGGGNATLSQFGEELVSFGTSMSSFVAPVSNINASQVSDAIRSFEDLLNLAEDAQGSSAEGLVNFVNQLGLIGEDSVGKFIQAFVDAGSKVSTAVSTLLNTVVSTITTNGSAVQNSAVTVSNNLCIGLQTGIVAKQASVLATEITLATTMTNTLRTSLAIANFNIIGQNIVQGIVNGINAKKPLAMSTVKNLCTAIINQFQVSLPQPTFNIIGQNVVQGLINGINAKKQPVLSAASEMCKSIIKAFEDNLTQNAFREIGSNAALGLKYGIEDRIDEIADAAIEAAREAIESAKDELDEHSPSRVMRKVGEFFSLGLARGITKQIGVIAIAAMSAADEAIDPVKRAVDGISAIIDSGDFDADPVIRPVMDLSGVLEGVSEIGSLMSRTYDLSSAYNRAMDTSSSFNTAKKARTGSEELSSKTGEGDTFEFNQYNYSPKALSRSEIYRQTNNQFSAFRRAVNPT